MSKQAKSKVANGGNSIAFDIFKQTTQLGDHLLAEIQSLLSIWGITPLQYYALQAIHKLDIEKTGIPSGQIGEHLYTRIPDITRLLDRMADKDWVIRERDANNKRIVRTRLTKIGTELVESAESSLRELESKQLSNLSEKEKTDLLGLLEKGLSG